MSRLLIVLAFGVTMLLAADVSGKWTGTLETSSGRMPIYLTLNQNSDGVSGTVVMGTDARQVPIEKAEFNGDELAFEVHDNAADGSPRSTGDKVYKVGGGVSPPRLLYRVEPGYTKEARAAKLYGTVVLYVEIDPTGRATNFKVTQSLGLGLDEKAVEAVKKWKFKPGEKDDTPVTVAATIEVNFRR